MTERPHHHGNLREALIEAGLALLGEDGIDGLTLRRAAARAGVSHAAPAHHFNGKAGLVRAIAAHGYRIFTDLMQAERFRDGDKPDAQLAGICRGYLRFAEEHQALFRLIFTAIHSPSEPDPELESASAAAYGVLAEVCGLFEAAPGGPGVNETMVWSLVHGYASLRQFDRLKGPDGRAVPFESILPSLHPRR